MDFFTKFPLDHEEYLKLKESMFNICLVSPELQGHDKEKIVSLQKELIKNKIYINAVCTKYPELWNYSNLLQYLIVFKRLSRKALLHME